MSFVSSKGNILCGLINIELYEIFAIINRAFRGLHCTSFCQHCVISPLSPFNCYVYPNHKMYSQFSYQFTVLSCLKIMNVYHIRYVSIIPYVFYHNQVWFHSLLISHSCTKSAIYAYIWIANQLHMKTCMILASRHYIPLSHYSNKDQNWCMEYNKIRFSNHMVHSDVVLGEALQWPILNNEHTFKSQMTPIADHYGHD